jgi:hypothetical protein
MMHPNSRFGMAIFNSNPPASNPDTNIRFGIYTTIETIGLLVAFDSCRPRGVVEYWSSGRQHTVGPLVLFIAAEPTRWPLFGQHF